MLDNFTDPMSGVSLQPPTQTPEEPVTLRTNSDPTPIQGPKVGDRAKRYDLAMGANSIGTDAIENTIVTGQEPNLRQQAALTEETRQRNERAQKLIGLATQGQFNPNIAQQAYQEYTQPFSISPNTVMEETFGMNYLKMLFGTNSAIETLRQRAMEEDPQATLSALDGTQRLVARQQIAITNLENAEAAAGKWFQMNPGALRTLPGPFGAVAATVNVPKILHSLGTMLPVASAANTAGPGSEWRDVLQPADYIQQARAKFWSFRNLEDAQKWLDYETKRIARFNPEDAVNFARAMVQYNMEEGFVNNIIGVADVTPFGSVATGVKLVAGATTLKQILKGSAKAIADGSLHMENVFVAVGDVQRAADVINAKKMLGRKDPLNTSEALWDVTLLDKPFTASAPGVAGREAAMRQDMILKDQGAKYIDAATRSSRVQRVPREAHDPMILEARERVNQEFPSANDHVISDRLRYNPLTNAYYYETILARPDGTLGTSIGEMERIARHNIGLGDKEFKIAIMTGNEPGDVIGINSAGMSRTKALDPVRQANKIDGFNSIQGTVRLKDGTEVKVSNKKDGIYKIQPKEKPVEGSFTATWRNADHDIPVTVLPDKPEKGPDGKLYQKVRYEGKDSYVPLSELDNGVRPEARPVAGTGAVRIDPSEITHYKNSAKGSQWTAVPSEMRKNVQGLFKGATIRQQGLGYYISIVRAADETAPGVRSVLLTTHNTNPVSLANSALGYWLRSAEDQLGYFQREARHVATHAPHAILERIGETSKVIGTLSKKSYNDLEVILTRNKDYGETVNGEYVRGRAFKSQAQLEQEWMDALGRHPTEQESLAYWTYHQLMDLDWVMRNTGVHRDLARVGVSERYTVMMGENGISFPGKFVTELPKSKEPAGVLFIRDDVPVELKRLDLVGDEIHKEMKELYDQGYRIVMVANPVDRPFKEQLGSGGKVNFVVTKNFTSEPLPMNLVDRNPGVHVIYPHEWFIKQPIVETIEGGLRVFFGDRTILGADTEREAKRLSKSLEDLRKMFAAEPDATRTNRAAIEAHIQKNLPRDYDFWHKKFYDKDPHLSLEHPILHTHSGKQTFSMPEHRHWLETPAYKSASGASLHNERNSGYNLMRNLDMDFMSDRDAPLMQVINKGSIDKPMWELETARTLDPYMAVNRGLNNSVRTMYLNDVKASAIEQWARQYGKYLTQPQLAESNPFQAFYHGKLIEGSDGELKSAKSTKARILQFVGTQTELGRDLDWFQSKVMNSIQRLEETKLTGQRLLPEGTTRWYSDHELRMLKDPVAFFRNWMYHFKFGFFNIKQFLVQSQGLVHAAGIMTGAHGPVEGPKMAMQALAAYFYQRGLDYNANDAILRFAANKAEEWGWNKQHYLEATRWMQDDGWKLIGNEQSMLDAFDPKIFKTVGGRILDWGTAFFREGERLVRMTSGFMAYMEWRKANPFANFDEFAKGSVLRRADDLSANMTRASHSALQEGVFRPATQFYTFSQRMLEQAWSGQRLTAAEKIGAFSAHSIMYGVPAAVAAGTLIPWHEVIRQEALTQGSWMGVPLNINSKWYQAASEGFAAFMLQGMTGKSYDVQGRYSPAISDAILKILKGEKNIWEIGAGATGTFIQDMWGATVGPLWRVAYTSLFGGPDQYQLTKDDIMPLIKGVSTANETINSIIAWNTMKYYSKNGRLVAEDLSHLDAAMIMLGLTRRDIKDASLILGKLSDQAENQRNMARRAEHEFRLAYQYAAQGDIGSYERHVANANVYMVVFGDLTDQQKYQTLRRVQEENLPLIKEAERKLLTQGYKSQIPERIRRMIGQQ